MVFILSVFSCLLLLLLERTVGLRWDFHPDAAHYIEYSAIYVDNIKYNGSIFSYLNVGYYVIVNALNANIAAVTALNILLFSSTNVMMFRIFTRFWKHVYEGNHSKHKKQIYFLLTALILFDPYRLHLSISVLKDTTLLFLLISFIYIPRKYGVLLVPLMASIRIISPIYLFAILRPRAKFFVGVIAILILASFSSSISHFLETANQAEMRLRDFDRIPSFQGIGIIGAILRAILWPIIYLSGSFLFISPNALFAPIFLQVLSVMLFHRIFGTWKLWNAYMLLFGIALVVTGYTSYVRYALPILYFTLFLEMKYCLDRKKRSDLRPKFPKI